MRPWLGIIVAIACAPSAWAACPEPAATPLDGIPALTEALSGLSISRSCTRGLARDAAERLRAKVGRVLELVRLQTSVCASQLGFVELSDIPSILERTQVRCANLRLGGLAANLGEGRDRSVRILIDRGILGLPGATSGQEEATDRELASILFHEALHGTTSGGPPLHNRRGRGRERTGCENSVYVDRVYLIQAACFGDFEGLHDRLEPSYSCPGVCERALTRGEPRRTEGGGPRPTLIAYPEAEAGAVCERVRRSGEALWRYRWAAPDPARVARLEALFARNDRLLSNADEEITRFFRETGDPAAMNRLADLRQWVSLVRGQAMTAVSEAPWIHEFALRNLDRYGAEIDSLVTEICAIARESTFCRVTAAEVHGALDEARAEIEAAIPPRPALWLGI